MKIEVEYRDIEDLKNKINDQQKIIEEYERQLRKLQPDELMEESMKTALILFRKYINSCFEKLGFEYEVPGGNSPFPWGRDQDYLLRKHGLLSDDITMEVSAQVKKEFRQAFLEIGVVTPEE